MAINKFDGEKFIAKRKEYDVDLFEVERAWQYLTYWQRKKISFRFRVEVLKLASRKKFDTFRAVIVSTLPRIRGGLGRLCACLGDRADMSTVKQLYAMSIEQERIEAIIEMVWIIERRKRRAVIVSACYRAGLSAAELCDLLSMSGIPVVYSLLFLLVFSVR